MAQEHTAGASDTALLYQFHVLPIVLRFLCKPDDKCPMALAGNIWSHTHFLLPPAGLHAD